MIKKDIFSLLFIKICLIYVKVSHVQLFATPWAVHSPWNSPDQNTGVGSCSLLTMYKFKICGCVWDPQSCLTLCDPMDCSSPGSSVCGILQARILEWVAIPFSRGSSQPRNWTQVSCIAGDALPSGLPGKPNLRYTACSFDTHKF